MADRSDAQILSEFKHAGIALGIPPSREEDCSSSLELTAFWLLRVLRSEYNVALDITDKNKTVVRLLEPKTYREKGQPISAVFNMTRNHQASALAAYILLRSTNIDACAQCASHKSRGPCKKCVAFGVDHFKGACSNCKSSDTPTNCSFANELKEREAKKAPKKALKAMKKREALLWFEQDDLKNHTTADLETLKSTIEAELKKRTTAFYTAAAFWHSVVGRAA